jgi:hypothetical protein
MINNLHLTWLHKVIEKWVQMKPLDIRENLGIASFSETDTKPDELYHNVKRQVLSEAYQDDETLKFLLGVHGWAGFSINTETLDTAEKVIVAARNDAIATLWLMAIPRIVVTPSTTTDELRAESLRNLVEMLIESKDSRTQLREIVVEHLMAKGISSDAFDIESLFEGQKIGDSLHGPRAQLVVSLILMKSTGFSVDIDRAFALDKTTLVSEASAYMVAMHTTSALSRTIVGGGALSNFDWPSIGNTKTARNLFALLTILQRASTMMTTSTNFIKTTRESASPWNERDFIASLIQDLIDHYSSNLRDKKGRGPNRELEDFIEYLKSEKQDIVLDILESEDRAETLIEELKFYRRAARTGEKPKVSPEKRFRLVLADIKQKIERRGEEPPTLTELVEYIVHAFDALKGLVEANRDSLGEDADRFTEALCFETAQRLLELLGLEEALMDLPWISRFIAEEAARINPAGNDPADPESRIERITSSFAGGVAYVLIQSQARAKSA